MELIRPHHESKQGIYAVSREVRDREDWKEAKAIAAEMSAWLKENNGKFAGEFSNAYAISHCQVCDWLQPWRLFVVDEAMVGSGKKGEKQTSENYYFPATAIFNAEILEAYQTLKKEVPVRKIATNPETKQNEIVDIEMKEVELDNTIMVDEGCMSFPHRTQKKMRRFFRIKVRYQYVVKLPIIGEVVRTKEEWIQGLKAHIFQHEVEHAEGKNMYFKS